MIQNTDDPLPPWHFCWIVPFAMVLTLLICFFILGFIDLYLKVVFSSLPR